MMWGRPIKTHLPRGGATLPKKIFMRSMGLICVPVLGCLFALAGFRKTPTTQAIIHIYIAFCLYWCVSVCLRFVLYNVRAYVCVRLNVNSS